MFVISVPEKVPTNQEGYTFLAQLDRLIKPHQEDSEIQLNFHNCSWLDANLASVLGAILDQYVKKCTFRFYDIRSDIAARLSANGMLQAMNISTEYTEKENYVPFRKFHSQDSDAFKAYIEEWIMQKHDFPKHTTLVHEKIKESIYEIYVNAIMHGECEKVYCCGEVEGVRKTLNMTIVDRGRTIPDNVNFYMQSKGKIVMSHEQCIKWAIEPNNTTKADTGGLGLALITDFIRLNEGILHIVSGNGYMEYKQGHLTLISLTEEFPGTIVNMGFNLKDDKKYFMTSEEQNMSSNDLL